MTRTLGSMRAMRSSPPRTTSFSPRCALRRSRLPMTEAANIVDWGLAARLGRRIAGDGGSRLDEAAVRSTANKALEMALAYTTLQPGSPVPEVEVVSREEWINANLAELM